ncbi:MAG: VWA domain-containing protein, partial [Chloroflexota bacterium]
MLRKVAVILVLSLLTIAPVLAFQKEGDSPPTLEITGVNATDLPTVTVTANVVDSFGLPVRGLTADEFTLTGELADLGEIVTVENVTDDDLSFGVVLVIDTSTSMSGTPLQAAKEAATLFIEQVGDGDPIALVTFDNNARVDQDLTTDKE